MAAEHSPARYGATLAALLPHSLSGTPAIGRQAPARTGQPGEVSEALAVAGDQADAVHRLGVPDPVALLSFAMRCAVTRAAVLEAGLKASPNADRERIAQWRDAVRYIAQLRRRIDAARALA